VTTIAQAPALDIVGVGYSDGDIRVLDIKQGDVVMQMRMDEGSVTGLSFRMGELRTLCTELKSDGPPILASASSVGAIAIWDLSKGGRVLHTRRTSHEQAVNGLEWVQGQPLLVSSSADNSVKVSSPSMSPADSSNGSSTRQQQSRGCSSCGRGTTRRPRASGTTARTGSRS
jgi:U3 small nucleolar RNA-associated protein 21